MKRMKSSINNLLRVYMEHWHTQVDDHFQFNSANLKTVLFFLWAIQKPRSHLGGDRGSAKWS